MKDFFTISEFAKLRNININSLRYYEKLGLLKPAYTDPDTGYRYYSAEQLSILDKIILCINLGIPLKEMAEFIDETGSLQSQKLMEHGRQVAQRKMNQLQNTLNFIDFSLKSIEDNKEFNHQTAAYSRHIAERRIITSEFFFAPMSIQTVVSEVAKIYKVAQAKELFPILPAGQLFYRDAAGQIRYRLFLQIMDQDTSLPNITTLPGGTYSCQRIDLFSDTNLLPIIQENLANDAETPLIIDNIILDKYSYGSRPSELQKPQFRF